MRISFSTSGLLYQMKFSFGMVFQTYQMRLSFGMKKYIYRMRFDSVRHLVQPVMFFYGNTYKMMIWYVIWYTISIVFTNI